MTQTYITKITCGLFAAALIFFMGAVRPTHAASLEFDPDSSEIEVDETVSIDINIDAGSDQIAGTDIYITYDSSLLSLQSVTNGEYFPLVDNRPQTGKLYISGVIANPGEYKTSTGTVATIIFKAVEEGSTTVKFTCDLTQTETSKINKNDINASNVIDCSSLNEHAITIGAATSSSSSSSNSSNTTSSLPASGVFDGMVRYASYGGLLLIFGVALRLLHKVV